MRFLLAVLLTGLGLGTARAEGTKRHTVVPKDNLWQLAKTYYSNPFRWKVIYAANQNAIKDPHWIYPGQVFDIPEVPDAAVGELGARPIETGAKIVLPPPEPVAAAEPAPEPAPPPAPPAPASAPAPAPAPKPPADDFAEDLRGEMPAGLTGGYPSMARVKKPAGWTEDGRITQFKQMEGIATEGELVYAKLPEGFPAAAGDRFAVYRRDVPLELDEDKDAVYLQTVGTVAVRKNLGKGIYSLVVLNLGDTVQPGDLIKRGGQ